MSILNEQLKKGRIHAILPQWRGLVRKAGLDISNMLKRHPHSYVALSWGKQSIVLAHLVRSVNADVQAVHWTGPDAELIGNFEEVKNLFLSRFPLKYIELQRGKVLRAAITEWVKDKDFNGVFIGLCAYESKGRSQAVRVAGHDSIFETGNIARCYPMGKWTQDDLAAYIAVNDLPLLRPYHRFGLEVRTSTGARPGSYTERAVDLMNSSNAAKMRKRWSDDNEL
ncbi:MAG: hypothetical protein HZB61_10220 [Nitrospirae bacterium]|nr:hypothetical protein [Nitrospirota bacterium]